MDNLLMLVMLMAVLMFGAYYFVKTIFFAIPQFEKIHRDPPKRTINGKEYFWLANILRRTTSLRDPRPDVVVADLKSQGYEVVVLEDAKDIWGKEDVPECRSVWGRRPDPKPHVDNTYA